MVASLRSLSTNFLSLTRPFIPSSVSKFSKFSTSYQGNFGVFNRKHFFFFPRTGISSLLEALEELDYIEKNRENGHLITLNNNKAKAKHFRYSDFTENNVRRGEETAVKNSILAQNDKNSQRNLSERQIGPLKNVIREEKKTGEEKTEDKTQQELLGAIKDAIDCGNQPRVEFLTKQYKFMGGEPKIWMFTGRIALCGSSTNKNNVTNDQIFRAKNIFSELRRSGVKPNQHVFSAMVSVLGKGGQAEEASVLVESMKEENLRPNLVTFNALMHAWARKGDTSHALEVLRTMKESNVSPNLTTYNTLASAFAKAAQPDGARDLLKDMNDRGINPDLITFNTILNAYARKGDADGACAMWQFMKASGMTPDAVTRSTLMTAVSHLPTLPVDLWKDLNDDSRSTFLSFSEQSSHKTKRKLRRKVKDSGSFQEVAENDKPQYKKNEEISVEWDGNSRIEPSSKIQQRSEVKICSQSKLGVETGNERGDFFDTTPSDKNAMYERLKKRLKERSKESSKERQSEIEEEKQELDFLATKNVDSSVDSSPVSYMNVQKLEDLHQFRGLTKQRNNITRLRIIDSSGPLPIGLYQMLDLHGYSSVESRFLLSERVEQLVSSPDGPKGDEEGLVIITGIGRGTEGGTYIVQSSIMDQLSQLGLPYLRLQSNKGRIWIGPEEIAEYRKKLEGNDVKYFWLRATMSRYLGLLSVLSGVCISLHILKRSDVIFFS